MCVWVRIKLGKEYQMQRREFEMTYALTVVATLLLSVNDKKNIPDRPCIDEIV